MFESATIELDRAPKTLTLSDTEGACFAEGFLVAVSCGWEHVIRLLEAREPDPEVRKMLEGLLEA